MAKRILTMAAAVILVVGGVVVWKNHANAVNAKRMASMKPPSQTVSTTKAEETVWHRQVHAVGSLAAVQGVVVSTPLEGQVAKIAFESGQHVNAGDLLVQLDVSTDEAQLHGFEAQAALARITLDRAKKLREADSNSQADLDSAQAQEKQALAGVENIRALIAKKTVRAPFAGRLGLRQVNLGQYLPAGGQVAPLQSLDPIYVNFSIPQQEITRVKTGQEVRVRVDSHPGVDFSGKVTAVNSRVDDASRNIQIQATLANADERLVPGMYATVDVLLPGDERFITLPETAIVYNPYGNAVFVVEKSGEAGGALVARQHFVQLGETRGDQVAVVKGLNAGDEVVTAGQIKLRNGTAVQVNNSVVPSDNPAPNPPNT